MFHVRCQESLVVALKSTTPRVCLRLPGDVILLAGYNVYDILVRSTCSDFLRTCSLTGGLTTETWHSREVTLLHVTEQSRPFRRFVCSAPPSSGDCLPNP